MDDDKRELIENTQTHNIVSLKLKYALLGFAMLFWLIGGLFAAIGGYAISQKTGYEELSDFATDPAIILASLGCLIFVISFFGVLGALRENLCLLRSYKILLVVVLVFEMAAGLVGFAFWPEVKKVIDYNLSEAIKKYTSKIDLRNMIDLLQRELKCCGSMTIDDWDSNPYFSCRKKGSYRSCGVPWSCCLKKYERNRQCGYGIRKNRMKLKLSNEIHTIGCLDKGFEFFKEHILLIAAVAVGFTLPLIIGIFMTNMFEKQIRKQIIVYNEEMSKRNEVA